MGNERFVKDDILKCKLFNSFPFGMSSGDAGCQLEMQDVSWRWNICSIRHKALGDLPLQSA